jgi:hypothetical protein
VLSLRRGLVTAVTERFEGLVRLEVDGRPCIAYPRLTGAVALGDDVIVNAQAVELGLGSGASTFSTRTSHAGWVCKGRRERT